MKKWFYLLIITAALCFLTQGSPNGQELAAYAVLVLGTGWIFSENIKPSFQ